MVGGGPVALAKVRALLEAGAVIKLVAPEIAPELVALAEKGNISIARRSFERSDVEGSWLVVAAAPSAVNRSVAAAAESLRLFVLAVDDTSAASAYGAGTLRRGGVTVAVSTDGRAPALAGLLREGLEAVLPEDLEGWTAESERQRIGGAPPASPWPSGARCFWRRSIASMTTAAQALRSGRE